MRHRIIYKKGPYRILEKFDHLYDVKNLIDESEITPEEFKKFEQKCYDDGVYGYVLEKWNPEIDTGWEHVDSCWGFIGQYDEKNEDYDHYIVDELKNQIKDGTNESQVNS